MANDREMGGNYPSGLTQTEFDDHVDPPVICHECREVFMEDDLMWSETLEVHFCSGCSDEEGEDDIPGDDEDTSSGG